MMTTNVPIVSIVKFFIYCSNEGFVVTAALIQPAEIRKLLFYLILHNVIRSMII